VRAGAAAALRGAALAIAGWACGSVAALETPAWQVEAGAGADHLSNAAPNWRQLDFSLRHRFAPRSRIDLDLRHTQRSGLSDTELGAAVSLPIDAQWSAALALAHSPTQRVLARAGARLELSRAFGAGWVGSGVLGRRVFAVGGGSSLAAIGVERYLDAWRGAVQIGQTRLDGGGTAANLRLQIDRSFDGERGRVGVILARGRELEGLPATASAAADVIDQRVGTLALVGTWPLAPAWALTGEASHLRYDDARRRSGAPAGAAYQRSGVRLGVRHDF
jgi:YaiO family outer membrane protein